MFCLVINETEQSGQVVWLENCGQEFVTYILLDHLRRVSYVQAADLNDDGCPDLAVAVYGYHCVRYFGWRIGGWAIR